MMDLTQYTKEQVSCLCFPVHFLVQQGYNTVLKIGNLYIDKYSVKQNACYVYEVNSEGGQGFLNERDTLEAINKTLLKVGVHFNTAENIHKNH